MNKKKRIKRNDLSPTSLTKFHSLKLTTILKTKERKDIREN